MAKRKAALAPGDCSAMLDWLVDHLHLMRVNIDAGYCDKQQRPSAAFRSLEVLHGGRPWGIKGDHRARLIAAIRKEMAATQPNPSPEPRRQGGNS